MALELSAMLAIIVGLGTTLGLITYGSSYWYWTRRPISNVVWFSLAMLGLGIIIGMVSGILSAILGTGLVGLLSFAGSIYAYYYLLNKTQRFKASDKWIKITITAIVLNVILGMLVLNWALSLDPGMMAQALIPLGG